MLVVFSPIFVLGKKTISDCNFVALLITSQSVVVCKTLANPKLVSLFQILKRCFTELPCYMTFLVFIPFYLSPKIKN